MENKSQWIKRVEVFHYVYSVLISNMDLKKIVKKAFEELDFDVIQLKSIEYLANNKEEIITLLSQNLAINWTWDRIGLVNQSILIAAYCEWKSNTIDKKIIIDQALITANKYSENNSKKFINAVLDKVLK